MTRDASFKISWSPELHNIQNIQISRFLTDIGERDDTSPTAMKQRFIPLPWLPES